MTDPPVSLAVLDRVAAALETRGYAVEPDFLAASHIARLASRAHALDAVGDLRPAAVGRGSAAVVDDAVRGDRIHWLAAPSTDPSERCAQHALEALRIALNRRLLLGLFELELHYAVYPAGARYAPHRDRFRGDDARVLSCVLYLNEQWTTEDGGALRLHLAGDATRDVPPLGGTLVTFLSDRFVHEVLPATRARTSLAGWFRRRT